MATTSTTISGHVARAIRLYQEPELFIGISSSQPWPDDSAGIAESGAGFALPSVNIHARNLGRVYTTATPSASMTSIVTKLTPVSFVGPTPVGGGNPYNSVTFKVTALSSNTYEIRYANTDYVNQLINPAVASYTASNTANTTAIPGVSLLVPATINMTAGHTYFFAVDSIVGVKKVEQLELVIPDPTGTIIYRGQNWKIVSVAEAYDKEARYVYISATFMYDEVPLNSYRQIGVFSQLQRSTQGAGKDVLISSDIANLGVCELIEHRKVIERAIDQRETFAFVIEC